MNPRKYICEFLGTFALVLAGTGAIVANDIYGGTVSHVGIALTFGMVVMAMIYAIGDISGAHINPAVSIGFWFAGRFPGREVGPYIFSQVLGAISASLLLRWIAPHDGTLGATIPSVTPAQTFVLEAILTFFLMFLIIHVAIGSKEKGLMAGVAIGAMVGLEAMFAGPFTGASMNPARSLGPALVSGQLTYLWIYLTAPILGALVGILFCRLTRGPECCLLYFPFRSRRDGCGGRDPG